MQYWIECLREAFEDEGIMASEEQIKNIASWIKGANENYSMAHGYDLIENPYKTENEKLKRDIKIEKSKLVCELCIGSGENVSYGPSHVAISRCWKCSGEGKVLP